MTDDVQTPTRPSGEDLSRSLNKRMMMAHGIELGQSRTWGHRIVTVLGPAATFPRNGKGMVLCAMQTPDGERWETHCWPETVAHWPLRDEA